MRFLYVAFEVVCLYTNLYFVSNEAYSLPSSSNAGEEAKPYPRATGLGAELEERFEIVMNSLYSFMALLDIVFQDGIKRKCTGTIIHDNVVITAAHCFDKRNNEKILAELTLSFVVIGTKDMFDAGYEQYLPIERVITHPSYKGWNADLSMVFTFGGLMSERGAHLVTLVHLQIPPAGNVTVLSWGRCSWVGKRSNNLQSRSWTAPSFFNLHPPDIPKEVVRSFQNGTRRLFRRFLPLSTNLTANENDLSANPSIVQSMVDSIKSNRSYNTAWPFRLMGRRDREWTMPSYKSKKISTPQNDHTHQCHDVEKSIKPRMQQKTKTASRTKPSTKPSVTYPPAVRIPRSWEPVPSRKLHQFKRNPPFPMKPLKPRAKLNQKEDIKPNSDSLASSLKYGSPLMKEIFLKRLNTKMKQFRSTDEGTRLSAEVFSFTDSQLCKDLVEGTMPKAYEIRNGHEIVCIASQDYYVTSIIQKIGLTVMFVIMSKTQPDNCAKIHCFKEEDSGAAVLFKGHLLGVALGGVEMDGYRLAVAVKLQCFCHWISKNLPQRPTINCDTVRC